MQGPAWGQLSRGPRVAFPTHSTLKATPGGREHSIGLGSVLMKMGRGKRLVWLYPTGRR